GINQTYSGLTKIRTRRRVADGTDGTEPVRPVLGRLREPFPLSRGGATPYRFLFIRHSIDKHIIFNIFNWIIVYLSKDNCLFLTN
ncbi:hypothetical protein, partial [Neisseria gonorrhoeae]|uniref:hypothetical protein n=1 Tax=Neisseria gonorrhoeae TaxID=485 RepID=UPI001C432855